jgi:hypothetical protein
MKSALRSATLLLFTVVLALSRAHALDLCTSLAGLLPYGILATDRYDALLGYDVFSLCYIGPAVDQGSVCSTTSRFVGGPIVSGDVVALASSGVAIANPRTDHGSPYCGNGFVENAVTGGGSISGHLDLATGGVVVSGVIDTSGTHPALAPCAQAMVDAAAASTALAALPAPSAQTLGRVVVKKNDVVTLHAGTTGVINVDTLKIQNGHLVRAQFQEHGCDESAELDVDTDLSYTGDVVINVRNLFIGQCAYLSLSVGRNVVFNVPGPGGTVRIGVDAQAWSAPILAPQRNVMIAGDGNSDTPTYHSSVWARRVKSRAFTSIEPGDRLYCP